MVEKLTLCVAKGGLLLAQKAADPVLQQLDPPRRTAVIMALLALILTGLFLVTFVMLGAHWVRGLARHKPRQRAANAAEQAERNQRLRESLRSVLPECKTGDTVELGQGPAETKLDL